MTDLANPPADDELEVSLFGPGIGECAVVHVGANEWLVVDSCVNPATRQPAALEYLSALGVDVATSVVQVVVTHWHDDHTKGAARVLEAAKKAEFVCSAAFAREEFLELIAMGEQLHLKDPGLSGVDELRQLLEIVRGRREGGRAIDVGPTGARADTLLHRRAEGEIPGCDIFALSPSSSTMTRALHDIGRLLPKERDARRAIVNVEPNDTAVVLSIRLGDAVAVLGSDLEAGGSPHVGWHAVLSSKSRPQNTAAVFKVAHHGSANAHHPGQWSDLCTPTPLAVLTPYSTGRKPLPTETDLARIKAHAGAVYVTAPHAPKASVADAMVQKTIIEVAKVVRTRGSRMGHVRVRMRATAPTPTVDTFGAAFQA